MPGPPQAARGLLSPRPQSRPLASLCAQLSWSLPASHSLGGVTAPSSDPVGPTPGGLFSVSALKSLMRPGSHSVNIWTSASERLGLCPREEGGDFPGKTQPSPVQWGEEEGPKVHLLASGVRVMSAARG